MNVNCKVTLTDEERNIMLRNMTGITRKRMVSRSEVNDFVAGCVQGILIDVPVPKELVVDKHVAPVYDLSLVPSKYDRKTEAWRIGWYRGRYVIQARKA